VIGRIFYYILQPSDAKATGDGRKIQFLHCPFYSCYARPFWCLYICCWGLGRPPSQD